MGRGYGRGGGWRHRRWLHATGLTGWQRARLGRPGLGSRPAAATEQELAWFKQQVAGLELALGELKSRLQGLDRPVPDASAKEHE